MNDLANAQAVADVEQSTWEHLVIEGTPREEPSHRGALLLDDGDEDTSPPSKRSERFKRTKRWRKFQRRALMEHRFAGLSTLQATMGSKFTWLGQVSLTGAAYSPTTNQGGIQKNLNMGTAAATTAVGGADQVFSFQQGVVAGGSATIDLYAMTDLLQQTSVAMARLKGYQIRLLSATDDATISPAPTSTSTGTVTNIGPTLPSQLDFSANGSGLTVALTTAAGAITGVAIGAAGTLYPKSTTFVVQPVQTSGSGGLISVTTNASGVPTAVAVVAGGAGYSNGTVPTVASGQYQLYTGGFHMYADPSANGFCAVSTTQRNFKLLNNDGSNAVTFEVDVVGGTS